METTRLDNVRRKALDQIDSSKKTAVMMLVAAAVFEGAALVAIILLMDFGETLHLLVFLCACLVYAPLAFGLFSLKAWIDLSTNRIIQAIDIVDSERDG